MSPGGIRCARREWVRRNAYRCVVAAARNRQNQLRPSLPIMAGCHPARGKETRRHKVGSRRRGLAAVPVVVLYAGREALPQRLAIDLAGAPGRQLRTKMINIRPLETLD